MKNTELPGLKQNLDISKFLDSEIPRNVSYLDYCNWALLYKLKEGLWADITINADGGSVKAHKSVLGSVSPVFEAMFKHCMQEQLTSVVNLPDISIRGLELFLVLVYVLKNSIIVPPEFEKSINEHFDELLEACCKYQVRGLGPTIAANLKFHLTPENCWDYYYRFESLEINVDGWWDYMLKHYKEVIESERFISEMETNPKDVQAFLRAQLLRTTPRTEK